MPPRKFTIQRKWQPNENDGDDVWKKKTEKNNNSNVKTEKGRTNERERDKTVINDLRKLNKPDSIGFLLLLFSQLKIVEGKDDNSQDSSKDWERKKKKIKKKHLVLLLNETQWYLDFYGFISYQRAAICGLKTK